MSILDIYDRMIIDYHIGLKCIGSDSAYILTKAFDKRLPGQVAVRTDNGPQFISIAFEPACNDFQVEHERIQNNTPNSIAHIESFHSILEDDCLSLHEFESFAEAYQIVAEYMSYYNEVRLHSAIGYQSPLEYYHEIMWNTEIALPLSA